jgi:hypothetical protein
MAEGDVGRENARRPAAYPASTRRGTDFDDVRVTRDRLGRGEVREKRSGGLEEVFTNGSSGGCRG